MGRKTVLMTRQKREKKESLSFVSTAQLGFSQ